MSQSDYLLGIGSRRPDSDAPADQYRHYEMAGAAHATPDELIFSASSADIIKAGRAVPPDVLQRGAAQPVPQLASSSTPRCATSTSGSGKASRRRTPTRSSCRDGAPVLDEFGNVQRRPALAVPRRADEHLVRQLATGASFCFIAGHERPLPQAVIDGLYGNHGDYVETVKGSVRELEDQAFLTDYDARQLLTEAAQSKIP